MGGSHHGTLVTLAAAVCVGVLFVFSAMAIMGSRTTQGSILRTRLSERLPGTWGIAAAAFCFFCLCESLEPSHAPKSVSVELFALLAASWLVNVAMRFVVAALARAVLATGNLRFKSRRPGWRIPPKPRIVFAPKSLMRLRYERPPPATLTHARA